VRLGVLLVMAVVLFLGLTKEAHRLSPATGSVKRKEAVPDYAM
jgi:hypothetical protein